MPIVSVALAGWIRSPRGMPGRDLPPLRRVTRGILGAARRKEDTALWRTAERPRLRPADQLHLPPHDRRPGVRSRRRRRAGGGLYGPLAGFVVAVGDPARPRQARLDQGGHARHARVELAAARNAAGRPRSSPGAGRARRDARYGAARPRPGRLARAVPPAGRDPETCQLGRILAV